MNGHTDHSPTPVPATAPRKPPTTPDDETLARAALTFCLDGADALMFATIKGADSASRVLRLVIDSRPHAPSSSSRAALRTLDETFITGIIRWGRKVTPQGMNAFHNALAGWHRRLDLLPSLDVAGLAGWFTADGTQWIIAPHSPCWPHQLADLAIRKDWAAPLCLWGIGDTAALVSCPKPLAVVGSRGVNDYGRSMARLIGERAASAGHLVVSGGAMGADAAAHWGALSAVETGSGPDTTGRTVAVFAGGLNHIGPQCNRRLFDRIAASGGALISELCPDTIPEARRFLLRNRIIAALADTVIVTQARLRSGALNTANWAAELNRQIYAVPGGIDTPHHAGCNRLIHEQRAILLPSTGIIDEICHPSHPPMIPGPAPSASQDAETRQAQDGSGDDGTPASSGPIQETETERNHHGQTHPQTDTKLTDEQRRVHTAIRRCRRRGIATTAEAIADHMDPSEVMDAGADTGTNAADPVALPHIIALLGEMELLGLVTINGGVVSIAG